MNPCLECDIEQTNLVYCCEKKPGTDEVAKLNIGGGIIVDACPELTPNGACRIYDDRPEDCRTYFCPNIWELDLVQQRELREGSPDW